MCTRIKSDVWNRHEYEACDACVPFLLSIEIDPKTAKGSYFGVLTGVQYLAPATESGEYNMCPWASDGCALVCLFTAGHGVVPMVRQARINRTNFFMQHRAAYWAQLIKELTALEKRANKRGMLPAARLNGTSDVMWEYTPVVTGSIRAKNIMALFPNIMFYDYTKAPYHKRPTASLPYNYDLTFSRSESNDLEVINNLNNGRRVAVVFNSKKTDSAPDTWTINGGAIPGMGESVTVPVINGDKTDIRFYDPDGVIVHLYAKGKARKDTSGFVVQRYKRDERFDYDGPASSLMKHYSV